MSTTRSDGRKVAAKTKLLEGEHSIDRAQPTVTGDVKVLRWSVRPYGYARPIKKRTQVPKRVTDGKLRERARDTAEEILRAGGRKGTWSPNSEIADYIEAVVRPLITESTKLSANSKARYLLSLRQLVGACDNAEHRHVKSLKHLDIRTGSRYRPLVECLQEIARFHGAESARQARGVLTGYVLQQLLLDELIDNISIRGMPVDLKSGARQRTGGKEGGMALTREEYQRAVTFLLELDPAEGAVKPKRGRWTLEDVVAKRRNAIDLTLFQAGTGLRISEARQAWCALISDDGGHLKVHVDRSIAKGGIERMAYVLEPRIQNHIRSRIARANDPKELVVSSPFDPTKVWDLRNASKAVEQLYVEMHDNLQIEAFAKERSHIWRATLNTILVGVVPEVMRAAQFGHTAEVNRKSYTDAALSKEMVARGVGALRP